MKATSFQRPVEYSFFVEGESWKQGEPLQGKFKIKNHGKDMELGGLSVKLMHAKLKDAHARKYDKHELISAYEIKEALTLKAALEQEWPWTIQTEINAPVTDATHSLFLCFGRGPDLATYGHLQLNVLPHAILAEILTLLTIHHRFVFRSAKHQKGYTGFNLDPPEGRTFAAVEQLSLKTRFEAEVLNLSFEYSVTRVAGDGSTVGLAKKKEVIPFSLTRPEYQLANGRLNENVLEQAIQATYEKLGVGTSLGVVGKV